MTKTQAHSKRPEKLSAIAEIDEFVKNSGYCFVLNYGGLNVEQLAALRLELAKAKSTLKVVKNTYLAKALEDKGYVFASAEISMVPQNYVALKTEDDVKDMEKLIDFLEENEDVQNVWHNWEQD